MSDRRLVGAYFGRNPVDLLLVERRVDHRSVGEMHFAALEIHGAKRVLAPVLLERQRRLALERFRVVILVDAVL